VIILSFTKKIKKASEKNTETTCTLGKYMRMRDLNQWSVL
jgi:hypothetical protein